MRFGTVENVHVKTGRRLMELFCFYMYILPIFPCSLVSFPDQRVGRRAGLDI